MSDVVINVTQPAPVQIGVAEGAFGRQFPGVYLPNLGLQEGIDASYGNGIYYLKEGYTITPDTILTSNKDSLTVRGQGQRAQANPNSSGAGSFSVIEAHHANAVLKLLGVHGSFENLAIHGDTWNETYGVRPSAGIVVAFATNPSLGSGKHSLRNISMNHLVNAFQAGEAMDDSNCDVVRIDALRIRDCDRVFLAKNRECKGWKFSDVSYEDRTDGCMYEFEGGGKFHAYENQLSCRATVLRLNQINPTGISNNAGIFNIHGLSVDAVARGSCLVEALSTAYSSNLPVVVNFYGGCISGSGFSYTSDGRSILKLRGGMTVNFFGTRFQIEIQNSIQFNTTGDSRLTRVNFDSCVWSGATTVPDMRRNSASDGNVHLRAVNCQGTDGSDIAAYDSTIGTGS